MQAASAQPPAVLSVHLQNERAHHAAAAWENAWGQVAGLACEGGPPCRVLKAKAAGIHHARVVVSSHLAWCQGVKAPHAHLLCFLQTPGHSWGDLLGESPWHGAGNLCWEGAWSQLDGQLVAQVVRHAACQMQDCVGLGRWGVEEQVAGSNRRHLVQVLSAEDCVTSADPQARAQFLGLVLGWEPVHEPPALSGCDSALASGSCDQG